MKIWKRLLGLSALAMMGVSTSVQADSRYSDKARCIHPGHVKSAGRIPIAVFAPPDINDSLVVRVFAEVEAIWGPTGLAFDWRRVTSTDAPHAEHLDVAIEEREDDSLAPSNALGWIVFTADRPGSYIHLSRARAEALIRGTPNLRDETSFAHELLIGRALGRALSHELGHYFLQSKVHTQHGLMRANWPSEEIFSIDRRGFELSADQSEGAVSGVLNNALDWMTATR